MHDKKDNTKKVMHAIDSMLNEYNLKGKFTESDIVQSWEEMMGKTIAGKTEKIYIRDGKLFLTIGSGPLKHQLSLQKSKIIKKIDDKFGEGIVTEVMIY